MNNEPRDEIIESLKDVESDFWIENHEREALIELLVFVGLALKEKRLWINDESGKDNGPYVDLCERLARRFANMPVHREN